MSITEIVFGLAIILISLQAGVVIWLFVGLKNRVDRVEYAIWKTHTDQLIKESAREQANKT